MTKPWTDDETAALANYGGHFSDVPAHFGVRAAAHIEALEARVAELEGPCSFCLETPGHGAAKPMCDGCAQLATDQAKTSRDLVERIATLEAECTAVVRGLRFIAEAVTSVNPGSVAAAGILAVANRLERKGE